MRKLYLYFFVFSLLLTNTTQLFSQEKGLGSWTDLLPYRTIKKVVVTKDKVYGATDYSLMVLDKEDNSLSRLSKINGLSSVSIRTINKHPKRDLVFIGYEDSSIDLIINGEIVKTPPYIKNDNKIIGDKNIYNATFEDNYAYLSCGFGIIKYDLDRREIKATYKVSKDGSSIRVNEVLVNDTAIIAATSEGIRYFSKKEGTPENFNNWKTFYGVPNPNVAYKNINALNKYLIYTVGSGAVLPDPSGGASKSIRRDSLMYYNTETKERKGLKLEKLWEEIISVNVNGDKLMACNINSFNVFDKDLNPIIQETGWPSQYNEAQYDNGNYWIADRYYSLRKFNSEGKQIQNYSLKGPASNKIFQMKTNGTTLITAAGGHKGDWSKNWSSDFFSTYNANDDKWANYNKSNTPELNDYSDAICVASPSGNPNHLFVGFWGNGIMELKDGKVVEQYGKDNSSLQGWVSSDQLILVSDMEFDKKGNLWVVNSAAPQPISVRDTKGNWTAYNLGSNTTGKRLNNMMIDKYDQKWITYRNESIYVVGKDFPEESDQVVSLSHSQGKGNIPGSNIYSMAADLEGEVWIGTDDGIGVFYSANRVMNGNYDAARIVVEIDGIPGYLLQGETVNGIAVDGGNRKWLATQRNGVFLVSPDGKTTLQHFTTENSPLISDRVLSITIDDDGLVYFATDKGLVAYKSNSSKGEEKNSDVYAYPNPVRPNYNGNIAIRGLVSNAIVKITDVSGNLVYSTTAIGGQAIWNRKTIDGREVNSGVYLVFISDKNGEETAVSKILFLK
ncbi:MAG: T9SS type A sorting domain-containing protein [Bacteroidales bacterium]